MQRTMKEGAHPSCYTPDQGASEGLMPWSHAGDGSGKEHCVWRSLVLHDGTMVTGDSGGNVQFWDAQLGTRTAAFQACLQPLWLKS